MTAPPSAVLRRRLLGAVLSLSTSGLVLVGLLPGDAHACGPLPCFQGRFGPPAGSAPVPANVPAFPWTPPNMPQAVPVAPPELRGPGGAVVGYTVVDDPSVVHGKWLVPTAPLQAGDYELRYEEPCDIPAGVADDTGHVERTFSLLAPAALPTQLGSFTLQSTTKRTANVVTSSGSCQEPVVAAVADFAFGPSPDLTLFLPVTRLTLLVDGVPWRSTAYGQSSTAGGTDFGFDEGSVLRVYAACPGSPQGASTGLATGAHVAQLQAQVAGTSTPLLSAQVPFTLSCDGTPSGLDGGSTPFGNLAGDGGQRLPEGAELPSSGPGGCQASGAGGSLLALALAWRLFRRRQGR